MQRAGDTEPEKVTNILSILQDNGRLFLNVTVTLKVCPRLACVAAPKQDCRRLIASSHTLTHTHTQAHTISICHLDYFKVSRSTDFILKAVSGNGGDEHMHAEMSISPCLAEGKRKGEGSF